MNNKEYLNEEQYQKTSKKIGKIGLIVFIFGAISFFSAAILPMIFKLPIAFSAIFGMLGVPCFGIGLFLFLSSKQRSISAFYAQSQMPVAKEGIEKIAPSAGVAAKEIAKGVKEGLKDDEE